MFRQLDRPRQHGFDKVIADGDLPRGRRDRLSGWRRSRAPVLGRLYQADEAVISGRFFPCAPSMRMAAQQQLGHEEDKSQRSG